MLCATIVFAPLGVGCLAIAGWPLSRLEMNALKARMEWNNRDHPMPNEASMPWRETEMRIDDVLLFELDEPDA
jgi:hypothetical protein